MPGFSPVQTFLNRNRVQGTRTYVTSRIGGVPVTAELGAHDVHEPGTLLDYAVDMNRCILIDPATDEVQ